MPTQEAMKLPPPSGRAAVAERIEAAGAQRRAVRRAFMREFDSQLAAALARIEKSLNGQDVHRFLADEMTDDPEHPVSESQVHDWLARRNGRRPPGDLIHLVCELDDTFMAWWSESSGFERPDRIARLSVEEQLAEAKAAVLSFGEAGAERWRKVQDKVARGEANALRAVGP